MSEREEARGIAIPLDRAAVVDAYFIEHRGKALDIAAFLDRVERAEGAGEDYRVAALRRCLALLVDGKPGRAQRMLELLSDVSVEPVAAAGVKGASGAPATLPGGAT